MENGKILLASDRFALVLERLAHQLLESCGDFDEAFLVGIQPRGTLLAERLAARLGQILEKKLPVGKLDITFYRDDFRRHDKPLAPHTNSMPFFVADKKVVLVDDVLYTGRTIQAALGALQHYGRASKVELLALVDRRFDRDLPIQPDFVGISIDTVDEAHVKVRWAETHGRDEILIFDKKA